MESSEGSIGSARKFGEPNGHTNLHEFKAIDVIMTPCGSCEGCNAAEDCGTKCENCVQNYIQTAIENYRNPVILTCLKRICHSRNIDLKRETVIVQKFKPYEIEPKMEISTLEPIPTELKRKMKFNDSLSMKELRTKEPGETGFNESIKLNETSSEDNLYISEDCKEASNFEMCVQVQHQRRKRCGTCPGCVVAQDSGTCGPCLRRHRATIEGSKSKGVCKARKCYTLKIQKILNQNSKILNQSCGKCPRCILGGIKFSPLKQCQKFSPKTFQKKHEEVDDNFAFVDHLFKANNSLIDIDQLPLDQTSKLTKVDEWLNNNIQFEENLETDKKSSSITSNKKVTNFQSVKRMKRCGVCSGCQAQDCGLCRTCEINDQFSDSLVLGKLPCFTNICESPAELTCDMDMNLQDDSSNGTVCPVKIVNGVLYDFRCFFCKKLPRAGSSNRSELMRHYSTVHYAHQLRKDFEIYMVDRHCLLCDVKLATSTITSHIGQKHNEVVNYLPPEAVALCPEDIQKQQNGGRRLERAAEASSQASSTEVSDWPQVPKGFDPSSKDRNWKGNTSSDPSLMEVSNCPQIPKGFDPSSKDRNWKGNTSSDPSEEVGKNYEIVDGWIIEHVTNSDEELPDPTLDYSGVGGLCSVCQKEFDEVTDAALHLHYDHHIKGGSSYFVKDCQNFIKSGFIQVSKVKNESLPATFQNKAGYLGFEVKRNVAPKSTSSKTGFISSPMIEQITLGTEKDTSFPNSDGYLDFESKKYVARKSTRQKYHWQKQINCVNSQHQSSSDEETSAQYDDIERLLLM